jgi:hypothetical protein
MVDHSQSRRSFLFSALAAGAIGKAALASPVQVVEQQEREFQFEGWSATEFVITVQQLGSLGAGCGTAVELYDAAGGESFQVPLFDLSILSEAKFDEGLKASARAHGAWHKEQGQTAPAIHIHLIRVSNLPNLRALLIHSRRCVLRGTTPQRAS